MNAYRVLMVKSEGRPFSRWEDNIKMDLIKEGWGLGLDSLGSG
jgi:hypothetical protein